MPTQYSCLANFDAFPMTFLKMKQYKSFPGGIFSIIYLLLTISLLVTIVFLWLLEKTSLISTISYSIPHIVSSSSLLNITVYLDEMYDNDSEDLVKLIDNNFKLVYYYRDKFQIRIKHFEGKIISQGKYYKLSYSLSVKEIMNLNKDSSLPRIGLDSCYSLLNLRPKFVLLDNEEEVKKQCDQTDHSQFYEDEKIKGRFFVFNMSTEYHQIQADYSINSHLKSYKSYFKFEVNQYSTFMTNLNKIAMTDMKKKTSTYINWLVPDFKVLPRILLASKAKGTSEQYAYHIHYGAQRDDMTVHYIQLKLGFFSYLATLGAYMKCLQILTVIPAIWTPYYASLLVIKFYTKQKNKQKEMIATGEKKNQLFIAHDDTYDWENLSYWRWVGMRFGCSNRNRYLNKELNKIRYEAASDFEKLYASPNENKVPIHIDEVDIKQHGSI